MLTAIAIITFLAIIKALIDLIVRGEEDGE